MGEKRKVSYYKYYERLRRSKKRIEELESENERLKGIEELAKAYRSMVWMLLRYIKQVAASDERIAKYREALKTIQTKDETSSDLIPLLSGVLEELETRKPIEAKAHQRT